MRPTSTAAKARTARATSSPATRTCSAICSRSYARPRRLDRNAPRTCGRRLRRRLDVERGHARDTLEIDAGAEAATALLLRNRTPVRVVQPKPQQMALARGLGPVLVAAPRVQHHEIAEKLDIAALKVD